MSQSQSSVNGAPASGADSPNNSSLGLIITGAVIVTALAAVVYSQYLHQMQQSESAFPTVLAPVLDSKALPEGADLCLGVDYSSGPLPGSNDLYFEEPYIPVIVFMPGPECDDYVFRVTSFGEAEVPFDTDGDGTPDTYRTIFVGGEENRFERGTAAYYARQVWLALTGGPTEPYTSSQEAAPAGGVFSFPEGETFPGPAPQGPFEPTASAIAKAGVLPPELNVQVGFDNIDRAYISPYYNFPQDLPLSTVSFVPPGAEAWKEIQVDSDGFVVMPIDVDGDGKPDVNRFVFVGGNKEFEKGSAEYYARQVWAAMTGRKELIEPYVASAPGPATPAPAPASAPASPSQPN